MELVEDMPPMSGYEVGSSASEKVVLVTTPGFEFISIVLDIVEPPISSMSVVEDIADIGVAVTTSFGETRTAPTWLVSEGVKPLSAPS